MSKMLSTQPPRPSSAAADPGPLAAGVADDAMLREAFSHTIGLDGVGFVWTDADLIVTHRHGALVDFVAIGEELTLSVLPLFGLQPQIQALRTGPDRVFDLPNVAIVSGAGTTPRLNLQVSWLAERRTFLLTVARVMSTSELEIELTRQTRARQIAEAQLIENARAIERANTELTRANRELAEFAYVISHDLKAPMRAMRYFTEDLEGALAGNDQQAAADQLARIQAQSRRMSQMLTDLLAYARIGRTEEAVALVDTRKLVDDIVASLPCPPGARILVQGDWPAVETLAAPLDLVLRNLLENAIKHGVAGGGDLKVSCTQTKSHLSIVVADDGPGIPPEYHEAIFKPFLRLGDGGGTEGSGIGLALVRKSVETCGAQLDVNSDPANRRGTTFTLRWRCST